tara:strand:- start:1593 stop:2042 length:450 start_codon:yes stop_codon:yes gene_type:complete
MVVMDYSIELDCDIEKFFKILTNYENIPNYLPRQLKKIEIVNETDNYKTIRATVFIRSLIKKEFLQTIKIEKKSENNLFGEVLDGIAKGTQITISILMQEGKTLCKVSTDIKLSLKTVILLPIIKMEYKGFLSGIFNKIIADMKDKEAC